MRTLWPGTRPPLVIAHRGASAACPENTAAAFDAAMAAGCDGIELDIQLSADGIPFVYHDRTLARIGAGRRRASSLTMAELAAVDAGSWLHHRFHRERILSLSELLERYARRTLLLIEMKVRTPADPPDRRRQLARAATELIRHHRLENRTALLCFDARTLASARAALPRVRTVLNLHTRGRGRLPIRTRRMLGGLWALSLDIRSMTPEMAAAAREAGRPLLTFTCNTERQVARALECGADAVMSDSPAWLRGLLTQRPAR